MTERRTASQVSLSGTLEEVSRLVVSHSGNASETLTNIARLIQQRFQSDVCSVYLLEPTRIQLVLAATIGLSPTSVGRVRMRLSEGLVGLVAEDLSPVVLADATTHPRFKYFPETGEELYHSFLGVPMIHGGLLVGVLVVQTAEPRLFSDEEVTTVVTAAGQLTPIVSDARVVHDAELQAERLRVVQVTMRTVQDIVYNCLNQLQLLRLDAEGRVPDESLELFDTAIETACSQLNALADMEAFTERQMAVGTGLAIAEPTIALPTAPAPARVDSARG